MGEVILHIGSDESLQGAAKTEEIGEFAKERGSEQEGKGCHKGDQVAEMEGD